MTYNSKLCFSSQKKKNSRSSTFLVERESSKATGKKKLKKSKNNSKKISLISFFLSFFFEILSTKQKHSVGVINLPLLVDCTIQNSKNKIQLRVSIY